MSEGIRDRWNKADIILKPVGGLFTALAVGCVGYFGSEALDRRQAADTNVRLYAELMSQREDAETSLRKDMFNSIIGSFMNTKDGGYEQRVLKLELLAFNFHEALDLGPLFKHVYTEIIESKKPNADEYLKRLERAANEVKAKQIAALVEAGGKIDASVDLEELRANPAGLSVIDGSLKLRQPNGTSENAVRQTDFKVEALFADTRRKEIFVKLEVRSPEAEQNGSAEKEAGYVYSLFSISPFDFPMIDNTRLPNGQRCAIVLTRFGDPGSQITLVYFPGSRASLKEKPFYDEALHDLLTTQKLVESWQ
jgi:hypothetical protein